jgi:hypothetical protein
LKSVRAFDQCTIHNHPPNAELVEPTDCNDLAVTVVQFQIIFRPRRRRIIIPAFMSHIDSSICRYPSHDQRTELARCEHYFGALVFKMM